MELTNEEKTFLVKILNQIQIKLADPDSVVLTTLTQSCLKKLKIVEIKKDSE